MTFLVATEKKRLVTYMSVEVVDKLQLLAEVRMRTMSNMIEVLVAEAVDKAEKDGEIKIKPPKEKQGKPNG
ncbi:MAG: hypothetical protein RBJ76_00050 (plasmid) [Stenomitos frigidus ULC029]